jgi:gas vesicle protein
MSSFGGTTTANGPSSTEQAKEKAQETAQQAAGKAKNRVAEQVDQRSTEAGHRVSSMAEDARSVAEQLRSQGKDQPAKLAEQAAQRAESLGDYLKNADGDAILRDVEDFGRRQPWAVIAGGIALGFAASRFLKASSSRRYEQQWNSRQSSQRLPSPTPTNGVTTGEPIRTPGSVGTGVPPTPTTPDTGVYPEAPLGGRTHGGL